MRRRPAVAVALPMLPSAGLLAMWRTMRRRWRCAHPDWVPFDGCPRCGKEGWR